MQYFYSPEISRDHVVLSGSERQHLLKSLRKKISDHILVLDGAGSVLHCEITAINRDHVLARINARDHHPPPEWYLHLVVCPTKVHGKMEWMVEKCTELGLAQITFMQCQRSERPKVNLDRLSRIAISAMKQSGRFYLPKMKGLVPFQSFIARNDLPKTRLIAHCAEGVKSDIRVKSDLRRVLILIGPEGDFTETEIAEAKSRKFDEITLGNARLRTETAGLYVTSVLNFMNQ